MRAGRVNRPMRPALGEGEPGVIMEYILSIGLNVGDSEPADQLTFTLHQLAIRADSVRDVKMGAADWQGVPERFVQARVEVSDRACTVARRMARGLRQDAIAISEPGAQQWTLAYADGRVLRGASVKNFPVILDEELNAADCRAELEMAAESQAAAELTAANCAALAAISNRAAIAIGKLDANPHGAVQAWSRGPIFPFVIVRSEVDDFPTWRAINGPGGAETSSYFSHDACERAAMDHLQAIGAGRG